LLAQIRREQAERRHLRRRVYPERFLPELYGGDHVVELRGRWHIGIELARGVDERRRRLYSSRREHRGQQSMFVLAIAVLIREHFSRRMRLVATLSERKADIAEILRHEIV